MTTLKPPTEALPTRARLRDRPRCDLVDANVDETRVGVSGGTRAACTRGSPPPPRPRRSPPPRRSSARRISVALRNEPWRARVDRCRRALFGGRSATNERRSGTTVPFERGHPGTRRARVRRHLSRLDDVPGRPRTFPLIAPRPMLIVNGELDPRNPLEGVRGLVRRDISRVRPRPPRVQKTSSPSRSAVWRTPARLRCWLWLTRGWTGGCARRRPSATETQPRRRSPRLCETPRRG